MAEVEARIGESGPSAETLQSAATNVAAARESPSPARHVTADVSHPVIFFDGVCGLCNRFVDFVIRRDARSIFRFAPLQGETARERLADADVRDLTTVVLLDHDGTHRKSTAVLKVLKGLGGFWWAAGAVLGLIPRPLRDVGYSWIAANRYAIFGKKESCRLPNANERERFLP